MTSSCFPTCHLYIYIYAKNIPSPNPHNHKRGWPGSSQGLSFYDSLEGSKLKVSRIDSSCHHFPIIGLTDVAAFVFVEFTMFNPHMWWFDKSVSRIFSETNPTIFFTGWWFQPFFLIIYGMSSFPLTNSYFSEGLKPPTRSWSSIARWSRQIDPVLSSLEKMKTFPQKNRAQFRLTWSYWWFRTWLLFSISYMGCHTFPLTNSIIFQDG